MPVNAQGFFAVGHGAAVSAFGQGSTCLAVGHLNGHGLAAVSAFGHGSTCLAVGHLNGHGLAAVSAFGHGSTCLAVGHPNGQDLYAAPELLQPDKNMHVTASTNETKINFLTFIIITPFILKIFHF